MLRNIIKLSSKYHTVQSMEEFQKVTASLKIPYIVDFYADWCQPCKMLTPGIEKREKLSEGKWALIKANVDL